MGGGGGGGQSVQAAKGGCVSSRKGDPGRTYDEVQYLTGGGGGGSNCDDSDYEDGYGYGG
jgi:hypothetical protein